MSEHAAHLGHHIMNRATLLALHRATCRDSACPRCESDAEARAADDEPTFDIEAAENSYEHDMDRRGGSR